MHLHPFLQNIRHFKLKSLYFKYLKSYLLIILLSFSGLFALFSYYLISDFNSRMEESSHTIAQKDTAFLSSKMQNLRQTYYTLTSDNAIVRFANHKGNLFYDSLDTTISISSSMNSITEQKKQNSDITDIIIYNAYADYMLTTNNAKSSSECQDELWYPLLAEDFNHILLFCDDTTLYLCQKLNTGMLIIEVQNPFHPLALEKDIHVFSKLSDSLVYSTADPDSVPVFSSLPTLSGTVDSYFYIQHTSDNWFTYVYQFPVYSILDNNTMIFSIIAIAVLLIFLLILLSFHQTHESYRHIANILSALSRTTSDTSDVFAQNELQFIYNNLIHSMNSKKLIETQLIENVEQLKKAQSIALQTQITPHYLFNILNMINISIQNTIKGDCPGTRMITLLSHHLRFTLNTPNNLITLKEELNHVSYYIELQKCMHEDLLQVNYDIDDSCLNIMCPRLLLQPLVENSIQHGMREEEILTITLQICCVKKYIQIVVADNGKGMPPDRLTYLQNMPPTLPENEHIGLMNVIKRLQLIYDQHFTYNIHSIINEGTTITLQFLID